MKKVRLSDEAVRYIRKEKDYLALLNPRASLAFTAQVGKTLRLLADYPFAGSAVAPVKGVRRLVSPPYHFDYVIKDDTVFVVSVQHARQGPAELEKDDDDSYE